MLHLNCRGPIYRAHWICREVAVGREHICAALYLVQQALSVHISLNACSLMDMMSVGLMPLSTTIPVTLKSKTWKSFARAETLPLLKKIYLKSPSILYLMGSTGFFTRPLRLVYELAGGK